MYPLQLLYLLLPNQLLRNLALLKIVLGNPVLHSLAFNKLAKIKLVMDKLLCSNKLASLNKAKIHINDKNLLLFNIQCKLCWQKLKLLPSIHFSTCMVL